MDSLNKKQVSEAERAVVGQTSGTNQDLAQAKEILRVGGYACVFVRGDDCIKNSDRGIGFLHSLALGEECYAGWSVADKIVGKAAAFIYSLLEVEAVWAEVMTTEAEKILIQAGIPSSYQEQTDRIVNREGTGLCPMEQAVRETSDPQEALKNLSATLKRLRSIH